jgi:uncharacterized surface protein with fasciclin (FAS1) repeats
MSNFLSRSLAQTVLVAGMTFAAATAPVVIPVPVSAQETPTPSPTTPSNITPSPTTPSNTTPTSATNFPDVSQDYWARPFIQALAERSIISGFPDGNFKPEQTITRAEFAAIIQKAFNQTQQARQLPTGGFRDVPSSYWATSAITKAYETGFMSGYPDNSFRPNQQIPKVQAIVALTSGLRLSAGDTATLSSFYTDATTIPNYATGQVAAATQANLVVNYPDVKVFNAEAPLTRAEAAAHLYQALVQQGQLQPIATNLRAASYIVGGTASGTTSGQASGQTSGDIVSVATASNSFTILTSLLKSAGLADSLQQGGPFTVFAPTDEAFAAVPKETLQRLQQPENRDTLIRLLSYHVVPGQLTANQLKTGELNTAEGKPVNVKINSDGSQVRINNAQVTQANIQASNGVIHAVNRVLIPPDVSLNGGSSQAQNNGVDPGRATRGGRSYIGVGGNIGLGGDSALAEGNFAVISKIGLTRNFSVRPGAIIGDDTLVMLPITFDLASQTANPTGGQTFSISPFIGAGVAIETSNDANIGLLLTGGVDVPLGSRFTLNGTVNAAFLDQTDVGLLFGVGYNF